MSGGIDLARLEAIIDASEVPGRIEAMLPLGVRPRQLSVRSLLIGVLICLADERPAHLRRVHEALIALSAPDKRRLGVLVSWKTGPHLLSYRQVEYTFAAVVAALSKQKPDGKPSQRLSETIGALTEASVRVLGYPHSSSVAIDWTDYESFASPPPKSRADAEEHAAEQPSTASTRAQRAGAEKDDAADHEEENQDQQGRCADPEAAWGHRKVNHSAKSETFYGYYLQAITIVREDGGPEVPELARRITLSSCKEDPPQMIVPVIKRMAEQSIKLGDLLGDSGYSYRHPETFAAPIRATGASLVIDLHPNDRGMKGTHQGAIICNGSLYCPATPKSLFALGPPAPAATEEELAAHDQKTEALARHKLSPLTAPDRDGYQRLTCPAAASKIRCPLRESSISLSHEHPTITSPPEHPPTCCKQQTITVPPSVTAKTAQKHDYPSKAHRASYARRTAAERSFSRLTDPARCDISRGWSRLTGLTPNAIMLACATITANTRVADAFAERQAEDHRRAARGLAPKRRRRRARTLHDLTAQANAPPAIIA